MKKRLNCGTILKSWSSSYRGEIMSIRETVNSARSGWIRADSPAGDIVVSSRVRVADRKSVV